jgi:hypothetical protein
MDADTQTLTPMPDGFCWKPRCHLDTLPTGLFLHGEQVASMQQRVDGSWLARLTPEDGVHAPLILRPCTSFDAGRRGCELWALRHERALRLKVAIKLQWIQDNVVLRGRGQQLSPLLSDEAKGPPAHLSA